MEKDNYLSKLASAIMGKSHGDGPGVTWQGFGQSARGISPANLISNNKDWVYVCVDKIATAFADVNIKLMRTVKDGQDEQVFDHNALTLLSAPNDEMTGRQFAYFFSAYNELTGNSYILNEGGSKNPKQLFIVPSNEIKAIRSKDHLKILGYQHRVGGKLVNNFTPEEIKHHMYPNPANQARGLAPLEAIADWVDIDNFATEFNRRFFINGAKMGGWIESEATSEDAIKLIKLGMSQAHTGVKNAHKIGVLPKGSKFKEGGAGSMKDMEFDKADTRFRDKILAGFGVPKKIVGISEVGDSQSDGEAAKFVFMEFTVKPKVQMYVDFLNARLIPLFDAGSLYFDYDDPSPDNRIEDREDRKASLAGAPWQSLNEIRSEMGLPSIDGGDVVQGPPGSIDGPVGEVPKQAPKPKVHPRAKEVKKVETRQSISSLIAKKAIEKVTGTDDKQAKLDQMHKDFIVRTTPYEETMKLAFEKHDKSQRAQVIKALKKLKLKKEYDEKALKNDDLFSKSAEVKAIAEFSEPILRELMEAEGQAQLDALGLGQTFDAGAEAVTKQLDSAIAKMSKSYTQTTLRLLKKELNTGIKEGDSLPQLVERVNSVYDFTDAFRAERIARSETFRVANGTARQAYLQSGVVKTVRWNTEEDEKVCEWCGPLHGKIISVESKFFEQGQTVKGSKGGLLPLNYSDVQDPPLHAQCRCFTAPEEISIDSDDDAGGSVVDTELGFLEELNHVITGK